MSQKKFIKKFEEFHARPVRDIRNFSSSLELPMEAAFAGEAKQVLYRSDKLNPTTNVDEGWVSYYHDHSRGVKLYRCDAAAMRSGNVHKIPSWIHRVEELTWLGQCMGFTYRDIEGNEQDTKATKPLPDLFCIPSGKALLVIQDKRRVLAIMFGGRLAVESRGIVH